MGGGDCPGRISLVQWRPVRIRETTGPGVDIEALFKSQGNEVIILDQLIDLKDDGTFRLNMDYFNYATGLTMTNDRFAKLFGAPARTAESTITQKEMDIARSIQEVTEEVVLRLARTVHQELQTDYLCLAGGVALNCVANGRILREGPFKDIWIQPAAGDAGGALGAALIAWHEYHDKPRQVNGSDAMQGSYLGPRFEDSVIKAQLDAMQSKTPSNKLSMIVFSGDLDKALEGRQAGDRVSITVLRPDRQMDFVVVLALEEH